MKKIIASFITGVAFATVFTIGTGARQNRIVRVTYVYDISNYVELAASALESTGNDVFNITNDGYYPTGERKKAIWYKAWGYIEPTLQLNNSTCVDYDPNTLGLQGPFPGAVCYPDGGWR